MFVCLAPEGAKGVRQAPVGGMPRRPRELEAHAIYHVFARGNRKQEIFADDLDRRAYLGLLAQVIAKERWSDLSYYLMPNHVHLLVETPDPNLPLGMQVLQGQYARRFNRRHRQVGHLFQGRYGAVRIRDDVQLWTTAAYIAQNPVRAGKCREPWDWSWSGVTPRLLRRLEAIAGTAPEWA